MRPIVMVIRDDRSISTGLSNQHAYAVQIKGAVMNIISACSLLPSFPLHASFEIINNGPITEKVVLPHRLFIHRLRLYLLVAQGWVEKVGLDPFGIASH